MTFVGKMLVVVQLLLSISFMALAGAVYSVHTSWKQEAENRQLTVTQMQSDLGEQNTRFQRQLDDATNARDEAVGRANTAEGENAQLRAQLANEQQQSNQIALERDSLRGLSQAKSDEAAFRDEEAQRERIASATLGEQVNEAYSGLRDRDDRIFALNLELEDLRERFNGLLADNGDLKKILRLHDLPTDPSVFTALEEPPAPVDGIVVATSVDKTNRTEAVEISVGSDDGVRKNHVLDVYSSAANSGKTRYLGKVRITHVTPDRAVGYVIESAKNGIIQRGDNVTTRL
ncbi:MAG: hypothetical protein KDA86_06930 [Planctomycetaceae bacterium]|nr:hypothetical protein [Planctomycetaceae bacterium]